MTTVDDVYEKDWNTYVKIYELKELLISKLEKYGIEVEHETPFADLIHMVNDIPSVIYDVRGNVMPADELKAIDGEQGWFVDLLAAPSEEKGWTVMFLANTEDVCTGDESCQAKDQVLQ